MQLRACFGTAVANATFICASLFEQGAFVDDAILIQSIARFHPIRK